MIFKVRHLSTICRVAFVNLTKQIGPERVEMSAKTGTHKKTVTQRLFSCLQMEQREPFAFFNHGIPPLSPRLPINLTCVRWELFRNRSKLAGRCFFKTSLRNVLFKVVNNNRIRCNAKAVM